MLVLVAAAVAAALALTGDPSPQSAPADPLIDSVVGPADQTPAALRQRFLAERRDPVSAPGREAGLRAHYRPISGLESGLRIRCGTTLCEVAGRSRLGSKAALNRTMRALQDKQLADELAKIGLYSTGHSFGGSEKNRFGFVSYWSSAKP